MNLLTPVPNAVPNAVPTLVTQRLTLRAFTLEPPA